MVEKLRRGIYVMLISNNLEFELERRIIDALVVPAVRQYVLREFNLEFSLMDPYLSLNGMKYNERTVKDDEQYLQECVQLSNATACLVLCGEKLDSGNPPKQIPKDHYQEFLSNLKSKNHSSWIVFQNRYSESGGQSYLLQEEEIDHQEVDALVEGIRFACNMSVENKTRSTDELAPYLQTRMESLLHAAIKTKHVAEKSIAVTRTIMAADEFLNSNASWLEKQKYFDIDSRGEIRQVAHQTCKEMRELLLKKLPKANYFSFVIPTEVLRAGDVKRMSKLTAKLTEALKASSSSSTAVQTGPQLLHEGRSEFLSGEQYVIQFATNLVQLFISNITRLLKKTDLITMPLLVEKEAHHHLFDCIKVPRNFLHRERELKIIDSYFLSASQLPGLFYGDSGVGKSALLSYAFKQVEVLLPKAHPTILIRRCCKTSKSSTLQLLLTSLTQQLASHYKFVPVKTCEYAVCVFDFWRALKKATPRQPIIILLDDIELLYPQGHVELFRWLPHKLPSNVKILMSTSSEAVLAGFKKRYDEVSVISIMGIEPITCIKYFHELMGSKSKICDSSTSEAVNILIQHNSAPLFAQLLADILPHGDADKFSDKIRLTFMTRITQWENTMEVWLVKHTLAFIALSRFGLSKLELLDLLSSENVVIQDSGIRYQEIECVRIPMNKLDYFLKEISEYVMWLPCDDRVLLQFRSDSYRYGVVEYYQLLKENGVGLRQTLADYWLGRYSSGRPKPIVDKQSDNADGQSLNIDRILPNQSYYWTTEVESSTFYANHRKMFEMPMHFLKCDRLNDLYRHALFSYEFIYSKLASLSVNDLIAEFYFMRQSFEVKNNEELEILITLLRHLAPILEKDPGLLGPELAGRMAHLVGKEQYLTMLHQQIDAFGAKVNVVLPTIPCYATVDAEELQVELVGDEDANSDCSGCILIATSPDYRFLCTLVIRASQETLLTVWDAKSLTKSQIVSLGTFKGGQYKQMFYMPQRDEHIVIEFIDVNKQYNYMLVNLDYAVIEKQITFPKEHSVQLLSTAKSYLILNVMNQIKVYEHPSGRLSKELSDISWPFLISPNDKYLITAKSRSQRPQSSTNNAVTSQPVKVDHSLKMISMSNGEAVCNLELYLAASTMIANIRNEFLLVGCRGQGMIVRYDIGQVTKRDVKKLKPNLELSLDNQTILGPDIISFYIRFKSVATVKQMTISQDEKYLIAEYEVSDMRRFYLVWHLISKTVVCLVPLVEKGVLRFSGDINFVYHFVHTSGIESTCSIINLSTGEPTLTVHFNSLQLELFIMKNSAVVTVSPTRMSLTTLRHMEERMKHAQDFVQNYSISLVQPQYNQELNVIYSNDLESSDFSYFNLDTNRLFSVDMSHSYTTFSKNPKERHISPDGTKLIMIYGSQHTDEMKKHDRSNPSEYYIRLNNNGRLVTDATAYRKPEIPHVNYFIGSMKKPVSKVLEEKAKIKPDISEQMFEQRILRVYDLNSCALICQISLTGERVLQLTNTVLLTFKPDYASITRSNAADANDIVSVFDVMTGTYLHSIYLEHSVIASCLVDNNKKMIVSCGKNGKWLKLLGGDGTNVFNKVFQELEVETLLKYYDELARNPIIKGMYVFKDNITAVLLEYCWKETDVEYQYSKVDMLKRDVQSHFTTEYPMSDVTRDGTLGVDKRLNIYDLNRGDCIRSVAGFLGTEPTEIFVPSSIGSADGFNAGFLKEVKFTDDNAFLIVVDNRNRQLTTLYNDPKGTVVGKALLHPVQANREREDYRISLGQGGRIIVLHHTSEFKVFVLKDFRSSSKRQAVNQQESSIMGVYKNLQDRVRHLMPHKRYNSIDKAFQKLSQPVNTEEMNLSSSLLNAANKKVNELMSEKTDPKLRSRSKKDGIPIRESPPPRRRNEITAQV